MLNQIILVGKLKDTPIMHTKGDGRKYTTITLLITRTYKDPKTNEYPIDEIPITLWSEIAENTIQYCKKGSTVGVKASAHQDNITYGDLHNGYVTIPIVEIIADKVTFINIRSEDNG